MSRARTCALGTLLAIVVVTVVGGTLIALRVAETTAAPPEGQSKRLQDVISVSQFSKMVTTTSYGTDVNDAYKNLLLAASAFPDFGTGENGALEVAAFMAHANQESGAALVAGKGTCYPGGMDVACSTDADCGYGSASCHLNAFVHRRELACERNASQCAAAYCDASRAPPDFPCSLGVTDVNAMYYGRGALQLSWNYNYEAYGKWANRSILGSADSIATNVSHLFASGIWFWMHAGQTTCHDAMKGSQPDFGRTVSVINGGFECVGGIGNAAAANRVAYFFLAARIMGAVIPPHTITDCPAVDPPYAHQAWCGESWETAMCRGKSCFAGLDSECDKGQRCYLDPIHACGSTWESAKQGGPPCYSGNDGDCPFTQPHCFQIKSPYACGGGSVCPIVHCNAGNGGTGGCQCTSMPAVECPAYVPCN
jgi:hypothetical protein